MLFSKKCIIILAILIVLSFSVSGVSAGSLFINESWTNEDIQNALDGDISIDVLHFNFTGFGGVYSGIDLLIDRAMFIVADVGVVLDGSLGDNPANTAFTISEDNVLINGFTILNYFIGVTGSGISNVSVVNNTFGDSDLAISFDNVDGLNIVNNIINSSVGGGISVYESDNVNISTNNISGVDSGIYLSESNNSKINGNKVSNVDGDGIYTDTSDNLTIENNDISDVSGSGISTHNSKNLNLTGNKVSNVDGDGIFVDNAPNVEVSDNTVDGSNDGISIYDSSNVKLNKNKVLNSRERGISSFNINQMNINDNFINSEGDSVSLDSSNGISFTNNTIYGAFSGFS